MRPYAVELLQQGIGNRVAVYQDNKIVNLDILEGVNMKRVFDKNLYDIANKISI